MGVPVVLSQSFGKLHCRVLNLQNTCSPLFRGKVSHVTLIWDSSLIPCGIPLESVERNKKQKQQDIYGIAGFEAFLALS